MASARWLTYKFRQFGLAPLENQIIDRDGRTMDLNSVIWKFNVPTQKSIFSWSQYSGGNINVIYALRRWVQQSLKQQSAKGALIALYSAASALMGRFGRSENARRVNQLWCAMSGIEDPQQLVDALRTLILAAIENLRAEKRMDEFYRLRQWYRDSADHLACLGFDEEFALELD